MAIRGGGGIGGAATIAGDGGAIGGVAANPGGGSAGGAGRFAGPDAGVPHPEQNRFSGPLTLPQLAHLESLVGISKIAPPQ